MINNYVARSPDKCTAFTSLGQLKYLSAIKHVDALVGNSSSGIIEAPSLKVPTVNIGDRQKGRIKVKSVIDCKPEKKNLIEAIGGALSPKFKTSLQNLVNPYEKKNPGKKIKEIIKGFDLNGILKKSFYDLLI
jgi:GDP/UDP-N,N'-diacetylbacillosamine 2-epimerase (hydrolysing)